nr:hypothetical protein [Maliibacterium massiliense]
MNKALAWKITRLCLALALAALVLLGYASVFGSPTLMHRASARVQTYIDEQYPQQLRITGAVYNGKVGAYIVDVQAEEDARVTGGIWWFPGTDALYDDYAFQSRLVLDESAGAMLCAILNQYTGQQLTGTHVRCSVKDTGTRTSPDAVSGRNVYDGRAPMEVFIDLPAQYPSLEAFSQDAYPFVQALDRQPFPLTAVTICAFDSAHGDARYVLTYEGKGAFADEAAARAACQWQDRLKEKDILDQKRDAPQ